MFDVYLPVAEITVSAPLYLGLAFIVGALSGALGVGGGFLITPLMIALGTPAAVAVGSASGQVFAASYSSVIAARNGKVIDYKLAFFMLSSSAVGAGIGVLLFKLLLTSGNAESFVKLGFMFLLFSVGVMMLRDTPTGKTITDNAGLSKIGENTPGRWVRLLAKHRVFFPRSGVKIGVPALIVTGGVIGLISGFLGIGGGFLIVPALIYLLRAPLNVAVPTSQLQVLFLSVLGIFFHALLNQNVDFLLSVLLIAGGAPGARIGSRLARKISGDKLRPLFSIVMIATAIYLFSDLLIPFQYGYFVREMQ